MDRLLALSPLGLLAGLLLPALAQDALGLEPVDEREILRGHLMFSYCFDFDALTHPNLLSLTQPDTRVSSIVRWHGCSVIVRYSRHQRRPLGPPLELRLLRRL